MDEAAAELDHFERRPAEPCVQVVLDEHEVRPLRVWPARPVALHARGHVLERHGAARDHPLDVGDGLDVDADEQIGSDVDEVSGSLLNRHAQRSPRSNGSSAPLLNASTISSGDAALTQASSKVGAPPRAP